MMFKFMVEELLKDYPHGLADDPIRKDGMPTKDLWEWCVANMYDMRKKLRKQEKELKIKEQMLALFRTREQTMQRKVFKSIEEVTMFEMNGGD